MSEQIQALEVENKNLVQINQELTKQVEELSHHKVALDASFMEQMQIGVNHKVTISQLRAEVQKGQQAMGIAQQHLTAKQKEIDELKGQLRNLQAALDSKVQEVIALELVAKAPKLDIVPNPEDAA